KLGFGICHGRGAQGLVARGMGWIQIGVCSLVVVRGAGP
ncbi:hypothetical protein A2U01_0092485, partial [Trifolium medium]|nr:hypothetical protein [Trifolium medium]